MTGLWLIFTARRYAKRGTCRRRVSVRPSVRLQIMPHDRLGTLVFKCDVRACVRACVCVCLCVSMVFSRALQANGYLEAVPYKTTAPSNGASSNSGPDAAAAGGARPRHEFRFVELQLLERQQDNRRWQTSPPTPVRNSHDASRPRSIVCKHNVIHETGST